MLYLRDTPEMYITSWVIIGMEKIFREAKWHTIGSI
jgi:hypothetical protein